MNYFLGKPNRAEAPPPSDILADVLFNPGADSAYGKSPMSDMQAGIAAFNDERAKRLEAEKALADRIASEPARFNAVMGVWQKSKQQVEAQRDMIREQRDNALADLAALKVKAPYPPVGSIVTLKSGGPRMTIAEDQDGKASCLWWAGQFFATGLFEYAGLATLPN